MLARPHRMLPFLLFLIIPFPELAADVKDINMCLRDIFSQDLLHYIYIDVGYR